MLRKAKEMALQFLRDLATCPAVADPPGHWLTLLGPVGTGKTMLAALILKAWKERLCVWELLPCGVQQWRGGRFLSVCMFKDRVRRFPSEVAGYIDLLVDYPLLVIDEIGAARDPSGAITDRLFDLLAQRIHKFTIITGNISFESLSALDERISSRMIRDQNRVVEMNTIDYALRQSGGKRQTND